MSTKIDEVKPTVDVKTEELRAKVDLACERMDQPVSRFRTLYPGLTVADAAVVAIPCCSSQPPQTAEAQAVRIENVESHTRERWRGLPGGISLTYST